MTQPLIPPDRGMFRFPFPKSPPAELARRALRSLGALIGDKTFLFGDAPRGADATLGAFVMGLMRPTFDSALRDEAEKIPGLVADRDRAMGWFA